MPLHISVGDAAASITESENGIMLKLPVSLNLPIAELLAALQLVSRDEVLKTPQSEHRQDSESAPPPPVPPPPMSDPLQFRLPGDLLDNAKWHEMCSSGAQTFTSLHGWKTYDIRSSKKKWILDQQDFAVLDDLNIQRKEPVPMKRMAPTPKVDDRAAVEAGAEEAFKKAMELSMAAQSSLRLPPETPPPASSLPPTSERKAPTPTVPDLAAEKARAEEAFKKAMKESAATSSSFAPPHLPPPTSSVPQHGSTELQKNFNTSEKECKNQ